MQQYIFLVVGFILADIISSIKPKLRIIIKPNGLDIFHIKKQKIAKKFSSKLSLKIGKNIINLHHSTIGWLGIALSTAMSNIYLFSVSIGTIIHHWLKEKKFF